MSSRPWKDTNSRNKTNNINVIHCDELITDELTTKNATFNNLNIRQKVTTNNFDVSNVEITDIMTVPDVSINNIGIKSDVSYINFIYILEKGSACKQSIKPTFINSNTASKVTINPCLPSSCFNIDVNSV